jgi:polar amino acid transport system ATP-binding protein
MIRVENVVKYHGKLRVLDGISLEVQRGEVAVLVGPSGGGKSTLLRCINGLEPFQSGLVRVEEACHGPRKGSGIANADLQRLRRKVGMVFQQFNLFANMNVLDNVLSGPRYVLKQSRAEAEPLARQLLERVGMSAKLEAMPRELSGGQQQRVAIARALAMKPDVVLFDEPTSALDPQMAGEVLSVIKDLAFSGQTMMVVTHAMGFAREVADTIHVLHEGRVVEFGSPEQVFDDPKTEATRKFLRQAKAT